MRRFHAILLVVVLAAGTMSVVLPTTAETAGVATACSEPDARVQVVQQTIDEHNRRKGKINRRSVKAVRRFNAQATRLNAERKAALAAVAGCRAAVAALDPTGARSVPQQAVVDAIAAAAAQVPAGDDADLAPLVKALSADVPAVADGALLQGVPRPAQDDPDPAFVGGSGRVVGRGEVAVPQRIVPVERVAALPGFGRLPAPYMALVVNAPANLRWVSDPAVLASASESVAAVTGADAAALAVPPDLQSTTEATLTQSIAGLLTSLGLP